MAASFALQTWVAATSDSPQNEQEITSTDGLHKWPGSSATAPQFLHVWAITSLLILAQINSAMHSGLKSGYVGELFLN
jgi:hypothetical protein